MGFHIGYTEGSRLRSRKCNYPSCIANPTVVESHLARELTAGRLIGLLPIVDCEGEFTPVSLGWSQRSGGGSVAVDR